MVSGVISTPGWGGGGEQLTTFFGVFLFIPTMVTICLICKILILLLKVAKWILEALFGF